MRNHNYASRSHRRRLGTRALAIAMALVAIQQIRPAHADPGDIFTLAAPVVTAEPPKAEALAAGDASVATQTGAMEYGFPISVPPGRNGAQPHLSLAYSSQGAIYGAIAAGWTLTGIPIITEDTTNGILWRTAPGSAAKNYESSMAGNRPLIATSELRNDGVVATYRAQNDSTYTRYEQMDPTSGFLWRAYTQDGTTYYFGETAHSADCTFISDEYAPLTSTQDKFNNVVEYTYEQVRTGECRIQSISWGKNVTAGLVHFATVAFTYDNSPAPLCGGVAPGSQSSLRTGTNIVTGASELDAITVTAYEPGGSVDHTRQISLTYDSFSPDCAAASGVYRELVQIQESAWGTSAARVNLPGVNFSYGTASWLVNGGWPAEQTNSVNWGGASPWDNVSWGYRYLTKSPTVEAILVDMDGDGRPDRLSNAPTTVGGRLICGASWTRNLGFDSSGNVHFDSVEHAIPLPTLKWADPNEAYVGGSGPSTPSETNESCSLNYQQTGYVNSHASGGCAGSETCSGSNCDGSCTNGVLCSDGDNCTNSYSRSLDMILSYRWVDIDNDGLVDLIASPGGGGINVYNLQQGNNFNAPAEAAIFGPSSQFGSPADCPSTPYVGDTAGSYPMCGGMYPYFIYKNHGNGTFGTYPDEIKYQPMPLESEAADASVFSESVGQYQGMVDVDGDGYVDLVNAAPAPWQVFLNDHHDQFIAASGATPFAFAVALGDILSRTTPHTGPPELLSNDSGFVDLNGDGLIDRFSGSGSTSTVELGTGTGLTAGTSVAVRVANDGLATETEQSDDLFTGYRTDVNRMVDLDGDGRVDSIAISGSSDEVYFNAGGGFYVPGIAHSGDEAALAHTVVVNDVDGIYPSTWEVRSDMIDLDGDGIPEGLNFGNASTSTQLLLSRVATPTQPPRLMKSIDNQRGAVTNVSYAAMTNPAVVEQHPDSGKYMPHTQWVVQSLSTVDSLASTTSTTSYYYISPHFSADDRGHHAFRGFDEVDTTTPSLAVTVQRYGYDVDWSGRLTATLVHPEEAPTETRSITTTTYAPFTLFGGTVITFQPTEVDNLTCANGQTELTCTAATAAGYTQTTTQYQALPTNSGNGDATQLLYLPTITTLQASTSPADGDRENVMTYKVWSDVGFYRVVLFNTTRLVKSGSTWPMFAETETDYDPQVLVPQYEKVWFDAAGSQIAVTKFAYDATGNLIQRWKPKQYAGDSASASYTYDARNLFVATETTEAAGATNAPEITNYTYDYGTGAKLTTVGPNVATCYLATPPCAPNQGNQTKQTVIDGLGRPLQQWDSFTNDGSLYTLYETESYAYTDGPQAKVNHSHFITAPGSNAVIVSVPDETDFDGHGRPIRKIRFANGGATADAITTFTYANDGTLASVSLPDPTANDTSTVTYTYGFDSLGRPTSIRRPDSTTPASQSGANISYNGVTTTTVEVTGTALGNAASTVTTKDSFGRLIEVAEQVDSGATWAMTNYAYGPDDNVLTVVDPEGVTTLLTHDFAGRRTQIARSGRTWNYTYDLNGNVIAELVPGSPSPPTTDINYTNTTVYDDLDRPLSKVIGPRALSTSDQALFGNATEVYQWDTGTSHIGLDGQIRTWRTFAPGAGSNDPTLYIQRYYDAQANPVTTQPRLQIAGLPTLSRQDHRTYFIDGVLVSVEFGDANGGSNNTDVDFIRDQRGDVQWARLLRTGVPSLTIGTQTRNVAGLVTKRHTTLTGEPISYVESNWTYDKLGRVGSQVVQTSAGRVAEQDLAYFGNDDPKTLDHYLGSNHKQFSYGYDYRHQLTTATENTTSGYFTANYAFGAAGRFTHATETSSLPTGGDVKPRDVSYTYAGTDPEEVTALVNTSGSNNGLPFASYAYDAAGNQISRCYGTVASPCNGDELDFVYDGKDQLRRATHLNSGAVIGSEEYWYDVSGTRMATIKRDSGGNKTELIWWSGDTEAHYDGSGNLVHVYSYVSMGTPVARVDRTTSGTATNLEFEFHGLANSTLAAVDQSGTVNASFDTAPFGEIIESTDSSGGEGVAAHRRRLNDKFFDEVSDLGYYGARYYDKTAMSWTQGDPLYRVAPDLAQDGTPRRASLYAFSLSNPLRYLDPDGRDSNDGSSGTHPAPDTGCGDLKPCEPKSDEDWEVPWWDGKERTDFWPAFHPPAFPLREGIKPFPGFGIFVDVATANPLALAIRCTIGIFCPIPDPSASSSGGGGGTPAVPPPGAGFGGAGAAGTASTSSAADLLRPNGKLIGDAGSGKQIRILTGGQGAADKLFGELTDGGTVIEGTSYPGKMVKIEGGEVGMRPTSTSGQPTIDVDVPGIGIREIKFNP